MEKQFTVLYTHQKQKKAKTWHDGAVKHSGHGNKAVLYDEKGGRLDSIYIKMEDLIVGEQIESDRYLILIEELMSAPSATVSGPTDAVVTRPQPALQRPQPQARCAGLKRKKSGFVPPRMVKQTAPDPSQGSDFGYFDDSLTMQADRDQRHQANSVSSISQMRGFNRSPKPSLSHDQLSQESCDSQPRSPSILGRLSSNNQMRGFNMSSKPSLSHDHLTQETCDSQPGSPSILGRSINHVSADNDRVHQNMFNMYTRFGKNESSGESASSQGSNGVSSVSGGGGKIMSPWSVYGSNNSSPSLSQSSLFNRSKEPYLNISEKSSNSSVSFVDNAKSPRYKQQEHSKKVGTKTFDANSDVLQNKATDVLQNRNTDVEKGSEDTGCEKQEVPQMKQKRNISQIMNLLKRKTDIREAHGRLKGATCTYITKADVQITDKDVQEQETHSGALSKQAKESIECDSKSQENTDLIDKKMSDNIDADACQTFSNDSRNDPNDNLKKPLSVDNSITSSFMSDTSETNVANIFDLKNNNKTKSSTEKTESLTDTNIESEEVQQQDEKATEEAELEDSFGCFDCFDLVLSPPAQAAETDGYVNNGESADKSSTGACANRLDPGQPPSNSAAGLRSNLFATHSMIPHEKQAAETDGDVDNGESAGKLNTDEEHDDKDANTQLPVNLNANELATDIGTICNRSIEKNEEKSNDQITSNNCDEPIGSQNNLYSGTANEIKLSNNGAGDNTDSPTTTIERDIGNSCLACHKDETVCKCKQHIVKLDVCAMEAEHSDSLTEQQIKALEESDTSNVETFSVSAPNSGNNTCLSGQADILETLDEEYMDEEIERASKFNTARSSQTNLIEDDLHIEIREEIIGEMGFNMKVKNGADKDCRKLLEHKGLKDGANANQSTVNDNKLPDKAVELDNAEGSCRERSVETDRVAEEDSQATYMTQDTMEFSCDTISECSQTINEMENGFAPLKNRFCQAEYKSSVTSCPGINNVGTFNEKGAANISPGIDNIGPYNKKAAASMFPNRTSSTSLGGDLQGISVLKDIDKAAMCNKSVMQHNKNDDMGVAGYCNKPANLVNNSAQKLQTSNMLSKLSSWEDSQELEQVPSHSFDAVCFDEEDPLCAAPPVPTLSAEKSQMLANRNDRWPINATVSDTAGSTFTGNGEDLSTMIQMRLRDYEVNTAVRSLPVRKALHEDNTETVPAHWCHQTQGPESFSQYESDYSQSPSSRLGTDMKLGSSIQDPFTDDGNCQFQFRPCVDSRQPFSPESHVQPAPAHQLQALTRDIGTPESSQDDEIYKKVYKARPMFKNACRGIGSDQSQSPHPPDISGVADFVDDLKMSGKSDSPVFYAHNHTSGKGQPEQDFHCTSSMIQQREDQASLTDIYDTNAHDSQDINEPATEETGFDTPPVYRNTLARDNKHHSNFDDLENDLDNTDDMKQGSKWEEYMQSDGSDDNDLDIAEFQQKPRPVRDFSVVEKSAELSAKIAEMKHAERIGQKIIDINRRVVADDIRSKNENQVMINIRDEQSQTQNGSLPVLDRNVERFDQDSQVNSEVDFPNTFSSMDSFDQLIVKENVGLTNSEKLVDIGREFSENCDYRNENGTDVPTSMTVMENNDVNDKDKAEGSCKDVCDSQISVCSSMGDLLGSGSGSLFDKGRKTVNDSLAFSRNASPSISLGALSPSISTGLQNSVIKPSPSTDYKKTVTFNKNYCDASGDLDVSLEFSSPEADKVHIGSSNGKSTSHLPSGFLSSGIRNKTGNITDAAETSSKTGSSSRCLQILNKMKFGSGSGVKCDSGIDTGDLFGDNASPINRMSVNSSAALPLVDFDENRCDKFDSDRRDSQPGQSVAQKVEEKRPCVALTGTSSGVSGYKVRPGFQPPSRPVSSDPGCTQTMVANRKFKAPTLVKSTGVREERIASVASPAIRQRSDKGSVNTGYMQGVSSTQLHFPAGSLVSQLQKVIRQAIIPDRFPSANLYKQTLIAAVTEYINTQLFEVARRYHHALSKVDVSGYTEGSVAGGSAGGASATPPCQCGAQSKMVMVKKQGANQGRYFYACSANRNQQCKFFQWADDSSKGGFSKSARRTIRDSRSLSLFMKDNGVHFYGESQLLIRTKENISRYFKVPKWVRARADPEVMQKKQIVLKIPYKGHSSLYAKDDLWVVSKTLDFNTGSTFIAKSTYHGPTASQEVEIEPLVGYSPSNWPVETVCHAIHSGNASSELSCIENIKEHIQATSPPVVAQLLCRKTEDGEDRGKGQYQMPRMVASKKAATGAFLPCEQMDAMSVAYIERYQLNSDQAEAVRRVACMFSAEKADQLDNLLLIHGVFGAGKSFLLSVVVLFLVEVFDQILAVAGPDTPHWKLLISSTTNVAVDRILNGLLGLGFEDFVRVGSVKKIAKSVLPYSVHATGTDSQELRDLQEMLRSGELTAAEKSNVRKSIEKHRCGENKKKLSKVKVVGATCAACSLSCLNNMEFPLVLLDECSQMTEPASLLPIARFSCQKLILVGDPKQLAPTIQGVDAAHRQGLEQTMFDRLLNMGHMPTLLRTQYRCHPYISALANKLFYGGMLENGVTETDRQPLLNFLPTVCLYTVGSGRESCEGAGSYYNEAEAQFVVALLQVLLSSGLEPAQLGVITLYRSQMARIVDLLAAGGDETSMKGVQVSTVDAFQGGEKDVIILSCVRTNNCGFIDSDKRMNVALTRARHHLLIVGHRGNLSTSILWSKVIDHCKAFENGVQSSEAARESLQKCAEEAAASATTEDLPDSGSVDSQDSSVSTARKRGQKRKSVQDTSQSQNSTDSLSGKSTGTKRRKVPGARRTRKDVQRTSEPENTDGNMEAEDKENVQGDSQERLSNICATESNYAMDTDTAPVPSSCEDVSGMGVRSRHSRKLGTAMLESDEDSDTDLPEFSCGKV